MNTAALMARFWAPFLQSDLTTNIVALLLLLARLGDIGSTYLATPKLLLEANSLARRWKWPFAYATLLVALVPYFSVDLGIIFLVASLLVCFWNFSGLWMVRAVGEQKYFELITFHASQTPPISALLPTLAAGISAAAVGLLLLYLPDARPFVALGILIFAIAITFWRSVAFMRFRSTGTANNRWRSP